MSDMSNILFRRLNMVECTEDDIEIDGLAPQSVFNF